MSLTAIVKRTYQDIGQTLGIQQTPVGNDSDAFDQVVPVGTDTFYGFNIKRSSLVAMALTADQDVTICTNGPGFSSPPTNTDKIVLKAGRTYVWELAQDGLVAAPACVACPISADVTTGIYVTTLGPGSPPVAAHVQIKLLKSV